MKNRFPLLYVFILSFTTFLSCLINFNLGYNIGQRDALRGIYRIDQAERDMLDPEGVRHILKVN